MRLKDILVFPPHSEGNTDSSRCELFKVTHDADPFDYPDLSLERWKKLKHSIWKLLRTFGRVGNMKLGGCSYHL